jgi:hypothetical protein
MNIKTSGWLKSSLSFLFFCNLVGASATLHAQQKAQRDNPRGVAKKTSCTNTDRAKFNITCKDRYFLGETPTITISIMNTSRSAETVKEAEYQKFSLEMTGIFQNDTGSHKKTRVYDGSWDIPKGPIRYPLPGETHEWLAIGKREPKFVKLAPGESTSLELNLGKTFEWLGVSKYKLTVRSEKSQKVVKEFEVYFDDEKSVAVLAQMLKSESDDESERHWAVYHLAKFSRTKFITLLEELIKSGNEKQRDFAGGILAQIRAGHFGPTP